MLGETLDRLEAAVAAIEAARGELRGLSGQLRSLESITEEESERLDALFGKFSDFFGDEDEVLDEFGDAILELQKKSGLV